MQLPQHPDHLATKPGDQPHVPRPDRRGSADAWQAHAGSCDQPAMVKRYPAATWGDAMPLLYNDPEHWRKRAEDARSLARLMSDRVGKETMMEIADKYDRLAARAVERLAQKLPRVDKASSIETSPTG
jgi:hypothetical protein